ncbi:PspC domain-containing protein [Georgenia sp. H159]|uniref:ATP-binding protein n=1 Tax=Georgenia sp. H159 TaxID=3076115 RepID=UPI002D786A32|nr:PspC domain-containing protein [Georgenia sp. H159]
MTTSSLERLPLRRPMAGRRVGGVCAGLAAHLDLPVSRVRVALVLAALAFGAGVVLYGWLWVLVPSGDPRDAASAARPAATVRLAPRLRGVSRAVSASDVVVGLLLLLAAVALILWRVGVTLPNQWLVPLLVVVGGAALVWTQLDSSLSGEDGPPASRWQRAARVGGGLLLAVVGVVLLLGRGLGGDELLSGIVASTAILVGVAVVLAPVWLRLVRDLSAERTARAREAERADIAAHLHDSVLQTLSLIRARADDPDQVARLARAQERELRHWLYSDRPAAGTSVAAALREVAGEVEDQHGVAVDVVTAGDRPPHATTEALLAATREALRNAVVHGEPPVSLYVEVGEDTTEVFVRDRGAGFDLTTVPADRHGVRDSIIGRIERHGGSVTIRTGPASGLEGTEVVLRMPEPRTGE